MKKICFLLFFLMSCLFSYSAHLKGGWIYYEYLGPGSTPNTVKYQITVKQYLNCHSTAMQIDQNVYLGIFDNSTNLLYTERTIPLAGTDILNKTFFNSCISSPPEVCYRIDRYVQIVELPSNPAGYTLAVQRCCRISGIVNITGSNSIGVSYTTTIPGIKSGINFENNNSPQFAQKDTVVVCYNSNFTFDFSATDIDRDSLAYSFCYGLIGGSTNPAGAQPNPPSNPPYTVVPYSNGYSGVSPMGSTVSVNSITGLISGQAPGTTGDYVVAVCVSEFRSGIQIGSTKKEIHITVAACTLSAAELKQPGYQLCDSSTFTFQNETAASNVVDYLWNFGDIASGNNNTSTNPLPTHTYSDTGSYVLKLKVQSAAGCTDSAVSNVNVFPGFKPDFTYTGSCFQSPFQFLDKTTTQYGIVNSWSWNFGESASVADTSALKNPTYLYSSPGVRTGQLIVSNSKGCIDTVTKPVAVTDLASLALPFKDTLICSIDTLPLQAIGTGTFTWTPAYNIINPGSANPFVFPKDTTTYVVTVLDPGGCINKDSITVNVLNSISVNAGADTTICQTDIITLQPISDGLQYQWTPVSGLLTNSALKNQVVQPNTTTTYFVTAKLGKCIANDNLTIKVAPYPQVNAGADVTICYGNRTQLTATIVGAYFTWTPQISLSDPSVLSPVAGPASTTPYTLTVSDTIGCPKAVVDTVFVTVIPPVNAFAGNDTAIVANQPLQLNATGGSVYTWSPAIGMNNPLIANPIVILSSSYDSVTYKVRVATDDGCFAEDELKVTVFKTAPDIFIPTGFTPNSDGKNDILKPVPVGIKVFNYFRIYNRWGQMIYSTSSIGSGWDGTSGGKEQATGTYVYMAQGTDYLGKIIFKKGTVVLIR